MREALREPLAKSLTKQITQAGHGFEPLAPVYWNGVAWVRSYANVIAQSNVTGIVTRIIDVNRFEITTNGHFKLTAPLGGTWAPQTPSADWRQIAVSADGTKQTAVSAGGYIYVSSDSGNTWTQKDSSRGWRPVAMSADGTKQTAGVYFGFLYVSTDSGNTWTQKASSRQWFGIAMSADGTKQTAVANGSGYIYVSTDSGNTWTPKDSPRYWTAIAMSADGTIQTAVASNAFTPDGYIYVSTDSGNTWIPKESSRNWNSVSMSADGTKQLAAAISGTLYVSTDSGNTWTQKESSRQWYNVSMSDDGVTQAAVAYNNKIYLSTDSGNTWTPHESNREWFGIAVSGDGSVIAATTINAGSIYEYTAPALAANKTLYLTATGTAKNAPVITGHVKKRLIEGESSSSGFVHIGDGEIVGETVADTITENTAGHGIFLEGSAVKVPDGTTVERPPAPVSGMMRFNNTTNAFEAYYNNNWGSLDSPNFRIHNIVGNTAIIGGGTMLLSNGETLVTGNGNLESMLGVNISVNLDSCLGTLPTNATTYYLYVDRYKLPAAVILVDSGRKIIRVTDAANFSLLTTDPSNTDLYRYVPVGYIRSATTGTAWSGAGAMFGFPRVTFHALNDFIAIPEKYTTTINTAAVHTLFHNLTAAPQIVQLYYWDGTDTIALDAASHLSNKTDSTLVINTNGLTFSSGEYVTVMAFYVPSYSNQITSNVTQFKSQWFSNTSTTTVPHGLSDAEDIKGYSVIEWDTLASRYRTIPANGLVVDYDNSNLYLDWSGLTPSSTLKYQIVTGGHPVPTSLPVFLGGYTKFVGSGPGSYATLTAALAASAPGDSILVTRGYSISATETVSVNGVKITFMPNIKIIQTAAATGLIVAANDVTIDMPSYEFTASGSITDAVSITGDDCVISKCRLEINNAGLTVTNGFSLSAASERNEVSAGIKKTAGTVTNSVVDSGTDNLPLVRG